MNEPITTTELEAVEYRKVTKVWTYEELKVKYELF